MLQLGIIGAGFIAGFQTRAMLQVRGVEVAGILKRRRAEALARYCRDSGLGEAGIYGSVRELAEHTDVLAIYAPNTIRVELMEEIVEAVKAGAQLKGVICEKPLARNVREARRLVDLAREVGLPTAYFENQVYMGPVVSQRAQLAPVQRAMGPMTLVRSAEEHSGPHEAWFWDPVRQGGGVLSDMGCHSIAVGRYLLTPAGQDPLFLQPVSVQANLALLKWGQPKYQGQLKDRFGLDYKKTPAEDFATGSIRYRNPQTGQETIAQFTNSWMFDMVGLRLLMEGLGPGYSFEFNTLRSPLTVFVGDEAAESIADAETAMEKSTASRGLIAVHYNEADIYGYTDENRDMVRAFSEGREATFNWEFGLETIRLVMAAYMAHELGRTIDLTDPKVNEELESYVPLIQQGKGAELLY
ncbi:MAG: Gfo/Idh/MocA family oxidoreductase [Spirochaetaceae bacterium]|nr:MAG: Gfo/Idh/MocA family oxidoreductase [Spirochaetaceae bacterium]